MGQNATEDMLSIQVVVGLLPLKGLAGGGAIRFVKAVPNITMRTGIGGLSSFTRVLNEEGTLSLDLLPTSDGNDALSVMSLFSLERPGGVLYTVTVRDTSGGRYSLVSSGTVITKQPDITIGDGSGINTWEFLGNWTSFTGGRGPTPIFSFEEANAAALVGIPVPEPVGNI